MPKAEGFPNCGGRTDDRIDMGSPEERGTRHRHARQVGDAPDADEGDADLSGTFVSLNPGEETVYQQQVPDEPETEMGDQEYPGGCVVQRHPTRQHGDPIENDTEQGHYRTFAGRQWSDRCTHQTYCGGCPNDEREDERIN